MEGRERELWEGGRESYGRGREVCNNIYFSIAFFQCYVCHATKTVDIDRGRISEPAVCTNCDSLHTMTLIHNRSLFSDKQMIKLQESPGQ